MTVEYPSSVVASVDLCPQHLRAVVTRLAPTAPSRSDAAVAAHWCSPVPWRRPPLSPSPS